MYSSCPSCNGDLSADSIICTPCQRAGNHIVRGVCHCPACTPRQQQHFGVTFEIIACGECKKDTMRRLESTETLCHVCVAHRNIAAKRWRNVQHLACSLRERGIHREQMADVYFFASDELARLAAKEAIIPAQR